MNNSLPLRKTQERFRFLTIFKRIPPWNQIAPVFAVIVMMIYAWTVTWFLWKLPSLVYYMNAGEIAAMFTYLMATNLLESILIMCGPVLLSMILPAKWFQQAFVARGAALVMPGLGYLMVIANHFQFRDEYPAVFFKKWSLALAFSTLFLFVFLAEKVTFLRKTIEFITDRAVIFLYVFIPISLLSLVAVVFRLAF